MKLEFTVLGLAQPAGSKRAFVVNGSARVCDANPKSRAWKQEVASVAREAYDGPLLEGPLAVTFRFFRPRPAGHFRKNGELNATGERASAPIARPDVLKQARGCEDALTGIIWRDDAQIVSEHLVKAWGEPARVEVEIQTV